MAGLLAALALAACGGQPVEMTDARVAAGDEASCAALELSEVRCTLLTLRAAENLDRDRPDHGRITSRALHRPADPPEGQEGLPASLVAPVVVVFTLADGERIGVPVLCPEAGDAADPACDPRTQ